MIEQAPELPRFNWSPEFNPREEEIIDLGPCIVIAKPIRLTKPERDLSALAPRSPEIQKIFTLKDNYKERVHPGGQAGSHYHQHKMEIIYPVNDLKLFFRVVKTGETLGIDAPERIGNTCFGFLIKHGVSHTIRNPSQEEFRFYFVLANMFEEDAQEMGDIIEYPFIPPPTQSLQTLLASARPLK